MKIILSFLFLVQTAVSWAGTSTEVRVEHERFIGRDHPLTVHGYVGNRRVSGPIELILINGRVAGTDCGMNPLVCKASLLFLDDELLLNIAVDYNQDGQTDARVERINIGSIATLGYVKLKVPVTVTLM